MHSLGELPAHGNNVCKRIQHARGTILGCLHRLKEERRPSLDLDAQVPSDRRTSRISRANSKDEVATHELIDLDHHVWRQIQLVR
jgi:hypothetical protein